MEIDCHAGRGDLDGMGSSALVPAGGEDQRGHDLQKKSGAQVPLKNTV
jgi:hypothetical protein